MSTPPAERVVNVGADLLADALAGQAVAGRPASTGARRCPAPRPTSATVAADPLRARRQRARARGRCSTCRARWSTSPRRPRLLGLERGQFLHAGPPIDWERASGPLRGALIGARRARGARRRPRGRRAAVRAGDAGRARAVPPPLRGRADGGRRLAVDVDVGARGRGARTAYASARSTRASARCCGTAPTGPRCSTGCAGWATCSARCSRAAVPGRDRAGRRHGILAQMLQMGDEAHNRNRAGTLMLLRDLAPAMVDERRATPPTSPRRCASSAATTTSSSTSRCPRASSRSTRPAASPGSTMVVAMARNGTDFGIQVAGTGDEWFTGPAQLADGLYLGDYGPDDANPDIGDSAITETAGHRRLRDGDGARDRPLRRRQRARRARHHPPDARDHPRREPALVDAGAGVPGHPDRHRRHPGVPDRASCRRSTPAWPASVAGVGQVGAGLVTPPAEIFPKALAALAAAHPRARRGLGAAGWAAGHRGD